MDPFSYVAAFDLDKTILSVNSSRLIVKASRNTRMMGHWDFFHALLYSVIYKFDLKDANEIVLNMTKWLKGLKETEVISLVEEYVVHECLNLIRPEIIGIMEEHRKKGGKVVMLSSAMPYICQPIATHLNMDQVICSELEVVNGELTGAPKGRLVFGKEKAVRMKNYCSENGFDLSSAYYYGDAFTDRFILDMVGNPVCVNPELKLKRLAKRKGWKII